ncbi:unnamed protein product [Ixodes persulcatus]
MSSSPISPSSEQQHSSSGAFPSRRSRWDLQLGVGYDWPPLRARLVQVAVQVFFVFFFFSCCAPICDPTAVCLRAVPTIRPPPNVVECSCALRKKITKSAAFI